MIKKTIFYLFIICLITLLGGCELRIINENGSDSSGNKQSEHNSDGVVLTNTTYQEIKLSTSNLNKNCYYLIESMNQLNTFYADFAINTNFYNEEYFKENNLIIIEIAESSGGNRHKVEKGINTSSGELKIVINRTSFGSTDDMAYWIVFNEITKEDTKLVQKVLVNINNREASELVSYYQYESTMPTELEEGYYFYYETYDFYFDSRNNKVSYNRKEATLTLTQDELSEIYQLLRSVQFDKYPEFMKIGNGKSAVSVSINILNSIYISKVDMDQLDPSVAHYELLKTIHTIIEQYIKSKEEFISLTK